jgi:hypothetical protein
MNQKVPAASCFQCGVTENDKPLIDLKMAGKSLNICPQCLPALIHHPDRVTEKLVAFLESGDQDVAGR